ncbi:hypothetical protein HDG38_003409 [Paraburkholderia sp. WSM4177]|nr:hypothetical protein [Paraburkholderia sp. WSM4177]MBB5483712.1 hypothetical protein [Paraburkholderia sp. WSM4180]
MNATVLCLPDQRRLCGNAAYERTFAHGASWRLRHIHFTLAIAQMDPIVQVPGPLQPHVLTILPGHG